MGKIKWGRVLLCSLIWLGVCHLLGSVSWYLFLRAEWVEAMEAPGRPFNEGAAFTVFTLLSVVAAIFALWLYAAIRPRYGPGPSTALRAGVADWVIGILLPTLVGVRLLRLPMRFLIAEVIAAFASFVAATVVAAWRYQE